MPHDTFNLNQDTTDKNAAPNKGLKYLIFRGLLILSTGNLKGVQSIFHFVHLRFLYLGYKKMISL